MPEDGTGSMDAGAAQESAKVVVVPEPPVLVNRLARGGVPWLAIEKVVGGDTFFGVPYRLRNV